MEWKPLDPDFKKKVSESFARQGFMDYIGATLFEVKPGYCEIHLFYREELSQQHGFFHAGAIGTIADNGGGYAAYSLMPPGSSILTVEYKLNLLAPGKGELLIGRSKVKKRGRTLTVCASDVFVVKKGTERLCATALVTLMELRGKADDPGKNSLYK